MYSKKIFILGLPAAGKTCITKVFFQGEDPEKLLSDMGAPQPTYGVEHYTTSWIETDVGILDSSGQELDRFLSGDKIDQEMSFGSADAILYVFDIENWINNKELVLSNLKKVIKIKEEICPSAIIYAFCHKIDLIAIDPEKRAPIFEDVVNKIQKQLKVMTVFTSIAPQFIHSLLRSMQLVLNDLSKHGSFMEGFLKDLIMKQNNTGLVMLDKEYKIISEHRSESISVSSLYNIVNLLRTINKSFERAGKMDYFDNGLFKSKEGMQLIIRGLNPNKFKIAFVIIFTETESLNVVDKIIDFIVNSKS
jgi:GTPase SAR1 family protein